MQLLEREQFGTLQSGYPTNIADGMHVRITVVNAGVSKTIYVGILEETCESSDLERIRRIWNGLVATIAPPERVGEDFGMRRCALIGSV